MRGDRVGHRVPACAASARSARSARASTASVVAASSSRSSSAAASRSAPAWFWGLVINVEDLDAAAERIGPDGIGAVTPAVQPGRKIATVRTELGLGVPVALMTP